MAGKRTENCQNQEPRGFEAGGVVWTKWVHGSQTDDASHANAQRIFHGRLLYPVMDGVASQSCWAHCGQRHGCPQQFGMRTWMKLWRDTGHFANGQKSRAMYSLGLMRVD